MPKCIYCLQEKEKKQFNTEHVVAQSFGTYDGNAAVLNHFEVCADCNTYFNKTFENVINLDSFETVERMRFGKPMGNNTKQLKKRTKVQIASGILEGLDVTPTVDNSLEEHMFFTFPFVIGIRKPQEEIKYDFFKIENLPNATRELQCFIDSHKFAIISFGYDQNDVLKALSEKGWSVEGRVYEEDGLQELLKKEKKFKVTTTDLNDSIKRRFAAKNLFNFLCYEKGKTFVLNEKLNPIREYIRFGTWSDELYFNFSFKPDKEMNLPNEHAHSLAYLWCPDEGAYWSLYGTVTWYGKMTYSFRLCKTSILVSKLTKNILPSTEALYCDNEKHLQKVDKQGVYIFRKSSGQITLPFPYQIVVGTDVL